MRYAFTRSRRTTWSIQIMCDVLQVSRSGYYAWAKRGESPTSQQRRRLEQAIRESTSVYAERTAAREMLFIR